MTKGTKKRWGDGYGHLFLMTVSQVYIYVKTHQMVYFTHAHTMSVIPQKGCFLEPDIWNWPHPLDVTGVHSRTASFLVIVLLWMEPKVL